MSHAAAERRGDASLGIRATDHESDHGSSRALPKAERSAEPNRLPMALGRANLCQT
jgi:hypothetical protein